MNRFVWVITLVCLCLSVEAVAQQNNIRQPRVSTAAVPLLEPRASAVSTALPDTLRQPSTRTPRSDMVAVPQTHSPNKALYLSFLPGAGQIYNHQAWKVPIIYGLMGGLSYWSYSCYGDMKMFRDEYLLRVNGGTPQLEGYTGHSDASIYNLYQSNNQYFQLGIVLTVLVYGLNLLDAYVYGHLFDFQIDNDLSLSVSPGLVSDPQHPLGLTPAVGLTLSF
ncbi:MAG: hypothetical protein IJ764_02530 [Bacteroidales bacterium]|nr:hypothetical protein [Bacteroidales bacterium]